MSKRSKEKSFQVRIGFRPFVVEHKGNKFPYIGPPILLYIGLTISRQSGNIFHVYLVFELLLSFVSIVKSLRKVAQRFSYMTFRCVSIQRSRNALIINRQVQYNA